MGKTRIVEYIFFFGILGAAGYVMWHVIAPFFGALAVAGVIVAVGHPFYQAILRRTPHNNRSLAAAITTLLVILLVVTPLSILGYLIFSETLAFYTSLNQDGGGLFDQSVAQVEAVVQRFVPSFSFDVDVYLRQAAGWLVGHIGAIFAETISTVFMAGIAIVALFYFFRDGEQGVRYLIRLSPLPDAQDEHVLERLSRSVRSVVLGTLVVALIQGLLTALGFALFGIGQPILWGAIAAVGALIPGIGTLIVFAPVLVLLLIQGSYGAAVGLAIWGTLAVGMIDNFLGPYLMSRGIRLHPFLVLLSVLGGIALFGPMGFILGPVTLSLFAVLLELYSAQIRSEQSNEKLPAAGHNG